MSKTDKSVAYWGATRAGSGAGAGPSVGFYSGRSGGGAAPAVGNSERMIAEVRERLGLFDRIAVDKASRTETRRIAGELVVQALAAQKERLIYKIGLELDASKKQLFVDSLREGSRIEQELAERSTEFEMKLMDLAMDEALAAHERTAERVTGLDARCAAGRIDEAGYHQQRANIEHWAEIFHANLNAKVEIILRNHAQQVERTLVLFRERVIQGHAS